MALARLMRLGASILTTVVVTGALASAAYGVAPANPTAGLSAARTLVVTPNSTSGSLSPTGSMVVARIGQTATLLLDGQVLVAGGRNAGVKLNSAELYDPLSGVFTSAGSMVVAREGPTATLLPDGRVLVAGGWAASGSLNSAEIYDPATGLFTLTGSMSVARAGQSATLLLDGRVLISGGISGPCCGAATNTVELYDPKTGTFSPTGNLTTARSYHTSTLLSDGRVLITGGLNSWPNTLASAELYDPSTGVFTATGPMANARESHRAVLLTNGQVLIAAGRDGSTVYSSSELYDPANGSFSNTGSMVNARFSGDAARLTNGQVLIAGGTSNTVELYDPSSGTFSVVASMATQRNSDTATLLPDGNVLIAGGDDEYGHELASAYLWQPAAATASVSCAPGKAGSTTSLGSGSTVACMFMPGSNATFSGWSASGFTPAVSMRTILSFNAVTQGAGQISAAYTDGTGSHTVSFAYTVASPAATQVACAPYTGNPTTVGVGATVSCTFSPGPNSSFTSWSSMGAFARQSSTGSDAAFVAQAPLVGDSAAAALTASWTENGAPQTQVFGYTVVVVPGDINQSCLDHTFSALSIPVDLAQFTASNGPASGALSLSGNVVLTPTVHLCAGVSGGALDTLSLGGSLSETGSITARATGSLSVSSDQQLGPSLTLGAFPLGPVVITPVLTPYIDVEASVTGASSVGINQSVTVNARADYDATSATPWSFSKALSCNGAQASVKSCFRIVPGTTAALNTDMSATVWFQLSFLIDYASGPFLKLAPFVELDGTVSGSSSWAVKAGFKWGAGITLAPAGILLGNPIDHEDTLVSGTLAQMSSGGGNLSTPDGAASLSIPSGALATSSSVGLSSLDPSLLPESLPLGVMAPATGAIVDFGGTLTAGSSATLSLPYDPASIPAGWNVAIYQDGAWEKLSTTLVGGIASAQVGASTGYTVLASAPTAVPGQPTTVTATPGNASAVVSWIAPADNGGSTITSYAVASSPDGKTCTTTGATSCSVSGLTNGTSYTFTVTATNGVGTGPASDPSNSITPIAPIAGATYHAISPTRILDTRNGTGGLSGPFTNHAARTFQVTGGSSGVPAGATAVTGNLTVTGQTSSGYLFIGPVATNNPASSTLNFPVGDDRANAVTVALGAGGTLSITFVAPSNGPTAQAIFDVTGYFTPDTSGATYHALSPTRVLDSRNGTGGLSGPFTNHAARTFTLSGVPAGATAVTGNLTVTGQTSSGYLFIGPVATNNPTSSTLNFPVGDDRANAVTVQLGAGGTLSITFVAPSNGPTAQAIFDVTGYFTADMTGATYVPLSPTRDLDTRNGTGGLSGPFTNHAARTFTVAGIPSTAVAVTGNLTVTGQTSSGYLFIGPAAANNPTSSTLNFPVGDDRANAVAVQLGTGGTLSITFVAPSNGPSAHAIFDVTGYFLPGS